MPGFEFSDVGKITILRLEQADLWNLRKVYGQHACCCGCSKPLAPGDVIVRVTILRQRLARLYHRECFHGSAKAPGASSWPAGERMETGSSVVDLQTRIHT
jgi:hypothetical protein